MQCTCIVNVICAYVNREPGDVRDGDGGRKNGGREESSPTKNQTKPKQSKAKEREKEREKDRTIGSKVKDGECGSHKEIYGTIN